MFDTSHWSIPPNIPATDTNYIESDNRIYLTWSHLTLNVSGNDDQSKVEQYFNIVEKKPIHSMRLRGGMNPNLKKDLFDVPSLTKSRFMWNGLRSVNFIEQIAYPLKNGLGQVTYKDASLLTCAEHKDPGGIMGNPPRAVASAKLIQENQRRNEILFGAILNYMLPSCALYKLFMRTFRNNGIDVYWFIMTHGPLPKPNRILKAQEDIWENMTLVSLKLEYSGDGYLLWIESVLEQARILKKTGVQIKTKLIDGLPEFFNIQKSEMRHDTSVIFPGTYGGLPEYIMTSFAANTHPMAGQPNGEKLLLKYFADCVESASRVPKNIPRGLVRKVGDDNDDHSDSDNNDQKIDSNESVKLLASDVTMETECRLCGGKGHAITQIHNGTKFTCCTKQLQDAGIVPRPNTGNDVTDSKYKQYAKKYAKRSAALEDTVKQLRAQIESMSQNESADAISESDANDQSETDFSDDSDASQLSTFDASDFANKLAGTSFKRGKKPILKKAMRK